MYFCFGSRSIFTPAPHQLILVHVHVHVLGVDCMQLYRDDLKIRINSQTAVINMTIKCNLFNLTFRMFCSKYIIHVQILDEVSLSAY